ncbi:flagellar basal body rod C-terminal domain-containing protein, partial [Burkholderia pseudomallei]
VAEAQTAISDGAKATLSGASGVTLDSEAVTLMRFQQAYSASSRVIQMARETFQTILEIRESRCRNPPTSSMTWRRGA